MTTKARWQQAGGVDARFDRHLALRAPAGFSS